jgi:hypothetical protein
MKSLFRTFMPNTKDGQKLFCCAFGALILPISLFAALGGDITSMQADKAKMQATLQTTTAFSYTLHELKGATGVTVKEYLSPAGKIFGVTWQGPFPPDLQQILGPYYAQYTQAVAAQRAQHRGRAPITIEEAGLVLQISGHPRSFRGRAYVPGLLPQGVAAEEIQ